MEENKGMSGIDNGSSYVAAKLLPISLFKAQAVEDYIVRFNQQTALNNRSLNNKINTAKINSVNTAKGKRVKGVVGKQGINAVKSSACWGDPQVALKDTWIFDSGCSRHMTRNKSYLTDYQDHDGGFVAFACSSKGGRITSKGKLKTRKLDFEDVYFMKELKFNLFSVSQMCDKKNSILFTETECLILSPDFKLPDENQATHDESNMWHRRLGHINFKTMNKLVKGNLVKGLPSKIFENDHSCVACQKGKKHKASCKSKLVTSVSKPLQILHMDLFRPTFVKSIMGKAYCLVVTDDYSRFSWVFFLAKKDETSGILKNFITGIENQLNHKVKSSNVIMGLSLRIMILISSVESKGLRGNSVMLGLHNKMETSVGNRINGNAGLETNSDAGQAGKENVPDQEYILLPLLHTSSNVPSNSEKDESPPKDDAGKMNETVSSPFNTVSSPLNIVGSTVNYVSSSFTTVDPGRAKEQRNDAYDDEYVGAEADLNNLETTISVSPIPTTRIYKDHPKAQIIREVDSDVQTRRMHKQNEAGLITLIN
ncbi:putative ribonuclease H-like domain-containing protein, partial [Tanacetum coccineum]